MGKACEAVQVLLQRLQKQLSGLEKQRARNKS